MRNRGARDLDKAQVGRGDVAVGRVPTSTRAALRHFDAVAEVIVSEWMARRRSATGVEAPHSWFKRNIYRLIKAYIDADQADVFVVMARRSRRSLVGVSAISANPFKLALFAMWSDNESLSRHQQRVLGTQMQYAYTHDVPPEHLIGFIHTAGSPQLIADKLKRGEREPGF